jgi:uncharacterized protein
MTEKFSVRPATAGTASDTAGAPEAPAPAGRSGPAGGAGAPGARAGAAAERDPQAEPDPRAEAGQGTRDAAGPPARLLNVDALRGFALFGILAVNIWAYADPYYATTASNPAHASALDHSVRFAVSLLFETKFYLLFSFLFGYSFTLQMAAAERAGASFRPRMLRRQGGLLALGLLHGTLLYFGEILALYALLGLILLACRDLPPRRAVRTAVILIAVTGTAWLLLGLAALAAGATAAPDPGSGPADKLAAFSGGAAATLGFHSGHFAETFVSLVLLQGTSALAMFFLGLAAGRRRLFADLGAHRVLLRRVLVVGGPVGVAGAAVYATAAVRAPGTAAEILAFGISQLTAPLLTAAYAAAVLVLFRTRPGRAAERALAPLGRTALTNYLFQSLALGLVFTGYGLGLVDRVAPPAVVAVALGIYAVQMVLSHWWLKGHRYGPGEWVLRAVTVLRPPPWRSR